MNIKQCSGNPKVIKDGVTIVKSIDVKDKYKKKTQGEKLFKIWPITHRRS